MRLAQRAEWCPGEDSLRLLRLDTLGVVAQGELLVRSSKHQENLMVIFAIFV
jgi:hypothetical protein